MRSRATTGICSSPSRSTPTRRAGDRRGRRRGDVVVGQPRQVGLVGVGAQPHGEALGPPVVAHARRRRRLAQDRPRPGRPAGAASGCPRPTRESTPECRPARRSRAGARRGARRGSCGRARPGCSATRWPGVVLVEHLDHHLGVVRLPLLGRDRVPEARPAAADERGERLQHRLRRAGPRRAPAPYSSATRRTVASTWPATRLVADSGASSGSHTST